MAGKSKARHGRLISRLPTALLFIAVVVTLLQGFRLATRREPEISRPYRPQLPQLPANYTETLVIASRKEDDMSWAEGGHFPVQNTIIYHSPSPTGKGREVLTYISYIIEAYEAGTLPDVVIFIHNHDKAWHHPLLLGGGGRMSHMLERLDREFVLKRGYFNLRCDHEPGCPSRLRLHGDAGDADGKTLPEEQLDIEVKNMRGAWSELHPGVPMPAVLAQPCCSEFAVTRDRITAVSLTRWKYFRDWVLGTHLSDWYAGRVWEYMWQFVLGGDGGVSKLCPTVHSCYCQAYGVCFGGGGAGWAEWDGLRSQMEKLRERYMRVKSKGQEDSELKNRIVALERQIESELLLAKERGKDPTTRAKEPFTILE